MRSRRNSAGSLRPEAEDDVLGELSINGVLASAEGDDTMDIASSASAEGTPAMSGTGTPAEQEDTPSRATATPMAIVTERPPPPSRQDTSVSASLAQTPMNDIFLSTLVLSPTTPTSSNTHAHETPGGSAAGSSVRLTPDIPEEPASEERAARASTDPGRRRGSQESNQYLLLAD